MKITEGFFSTLFILALLSPSTLCPIGEREIKELGVRCDDMERGCQWTGTIGTLDNHITTCLDTREGQHKTLSEGQPMVFKLPGYASKKNNNENFYSTPFSTSSGGYRMHIRVDANGSGEKKKKLKTKRKCDDPLPNWLPTSGEVLCRTLL